MLQLQNSPPPHKHPNSGDCIPPVEGEGLPADIGATVNVSLKHMVEEKVINERAGQAQWVQEGADLCLQATLPTNDRAKGFWDAQVLPQHDHVDLQGWEEEWSVSAGFSQECPY